MVTPGYLIEDCIMISNNADENMNSHHLRLVTLSHVLSDYLHFPVEPHEACMMIYTIDADHVNSRTFRQQSFVT